MKATPKMLIALAGHVQGDELSEEVLRGCEEFLCSFFLSRWNPHWGSKDAHVLLFKQLRDQQGVNKLPGTQGAWIEHMRCAHDQAIIFFMAPRYGIKPVLTLQPGGGYGDT